MLKRLQRKTLVPAQIIGYAITLLVGVSILLIAIQAYSDIKLMLAEQTDVFDSHAVTISKNISLFKTMNKDAIYFDDHEIEELRKQDFIKDVTKFKSATYSPWAEFDSRSVGNLHTEMFFESVQDKYIDVHTEDWEWDSCPNFIPIIIPEDFLNLYNFCFAESQSLPVISQGTMKMISFSIILEGNDQKEVFESRIVGFSRKIKTILVPEKFMDWSNEKFGKSDTPKASRLLVEFKNANDQRIPTFFENHNYAIDESELEFSKMSFFFKLAMVFVIVIASLIILLSMAFIVMSLNLVMQRNRKMLVNLYNIGYSPQQMARFYQIVISAISIVNIILAATIASKVRQMYLEQLSAVFEKPNNPVYIWSASIVLLTVLMLVYNMIILHNIRKIVKA